MIVESAESLDSFFCQLCRLDDDIETVTDLLHEKYQKGSPPGPINVPLEIGDLLAAMFTEDGFWYRATVSGMKPDGTVEVTFIDYGNKENVPRVEFSRRLKPLTKELLHYPALQGIECSLSRVSSEGEHFSWNPRAHEAFVGYAVGRSFDAKINSESAPYSVNLGDDSGSIHSWLTREGLLAARETDPEVVQEDYYELEVEPGTSFDVYVTSVVNPEQFYVQKAANSEALDRGRAKLISL